MPKWTDYTIKTNPADKDEMMILDTAGKANKRLSLSALSDWIIGKIANKVFENLQTQNKTILGAINELNSKQFKANSYIISSADSSKIVSVKWGDTNNHMTSFLLIDDNLSTSAYITGKSSGITEIAKGSEGVSLVLDASSATLKVTLNPWSKVFLICLDPVTIS